MQLEPFSLLYLPYTLFAPIFGVCLIIIIIIIIITFNETYEYLYLFNLAVFDDTTMEWSVLTMKSQNGLGRNQGLCISRQENIPKMRVRPSRVQTRVVHLLESLKIGEMQRSQVWERLLAKKLLKKNLLRGCNICWARSWQCVRDYIACSFDKPRKKRLCLVEQPHILQGLVDHMARMSSMALKFSVVMLLLCQWQELSRV